MAWKITLWRQDIGISSIKTFEEEITKMEKEIHQACRKKKWTKKKAEDSPMISLKLV